jgi:hypothetical protein
MKEIPLKKILDKAGVLLIAIVMILSAVVVTADTNNGSPKFIVAGAEDILQSQQTNMFDPDWIHFDDGTNVGAVGIDIGGTFQFAIRITPTELVGYDGYELTVVHWHHGYMSSPPHAGTIIIYDAGTSWKPGSVITSEPFYVPSAGWFDIPLSNPVSIDPSRDIWVSIEVTHEEYEFPAGIGPGPVVAGKGGWLSMDGVHWGQLGIDYPELDHNWNIWAKLETPSEPPAKPQRPEGPTEGVVGVEHMFSTSTTDPEGDQVSYMWDWSDGTPNEWTEYSDSGKTVNASHIWTEAGTYAIRVKAKDLHGDESDWSDSKTIYIVEGGPILEIGNISGGLFKVRMTIKNTGDVTATGVNWSITLVGGVLLSGRETSGRIGIMPAGGETTVGSNFIIGFGKTVVTVTAEKPGISSDIAERDAFVFLFFITLN